MAVTLLMSALLGACGGSVGQGSSSGEGDTIRLMYADNLTLVRHAEAGYTVAVLRNPWDTLRTLHTYILVPGDSALPAHLPDGTVVRTPLTRSLVYSSVHCALLNRLGAADAIGGVCDLRYLYVPEVTERCARGLVADCGDALNPNVERIVELSPDAILLSPFENSGGYGRVEKVGAPLIECADYMETSALGRAEWVRFYGMLFGCERQADSLFAHVDSCYRALNSLAARSAVSRSVLPDLKTGGTWYVPGGNSTIGGLLRDAGARYAFDEDPHSGSLPLSFEAVFSRAGEADVWFFRYNRERDLTYRDLASDYAGYTGLRPYRLRTAYGCNTARVPFYEETPFRPDLLLADFVQLVHPDIRLEGGLRYFTPLEEGN